MLLHTIVRDQIFDANSISHFRTCLTARNIADAQTVLQIDPNRKPPDGELKLAYNGGSGFTFSVTGNATVTWSEVLTSRVSSLPPGLKLSSTGLLTGTPTAVGTFNFRLQATGTCTACAAPPTAQANFTIHIFSPLQITTSPTLPAATVGQPYQFTFTAQGGSGSYAWALGNCTTTAVPAGLCIDALVGVVSGTPTSPGTYTITVTVLDLQIQNTASITATLSITALPVALSLSGPINLGTFLLGQTVRGHVTAAGGKTPYTFVSTGVPSGMTGSNTSLTGTPTTPGNYSVSFQVTDAAEATAKSSISFSILGLKTSAVPAGIVGIAYQLQLNAQGGSPPYSFSGSGLPTECLCPPADF